MPDQRASISNPSASTQTVPACKASNWKAQDLMHLSSLSYCAAGFNLALHTLHKITGTLRFLLSILSPAKIMRATRPATRQRRGDGHAAAVASASTAAAAAAAATLLLTTTTTLLLFSSSLLPAGVDAFVVRPSSSPSSSSCSSSTTSIRPSSFARSSSSSGSRRNPTAQWSTSNKPSSGQEERDWKQALLEDDDLDIDAIIAANKEVRGGRE